jgi:hypothetical protein
MLALGRLTQITLRTDPKAALGYAQDGFKRALEAEDRTEQATFKNDEARAQLALAGSDFTAALACAGAAVDAARLDRNDEAELMAYGILVRALTRAGILDEARERAATGYSVSVALGRELGADQFPETPVAVRIEPVAPFRHGRGRTKTSAEDAHPSERSLSKSPVPGFTRACDGHRQEVTS